MKQQAPLSTDSLDTWLNYWSHVHVTGIDLGLERVIPVAEKLGVTKPTAKVFTVAGTNGKGSTTTTLASILKAQGYKVGLYQSPHIYRFNERVKLGGVEVDDQSLIDAFVQVDQARRDCDLSLSFLKQPLWLLLSFLSNNYAMYGCLKLVWAGVLMSSTSLILILL